MKVTAVQDFLPSGQFRPSDRLIDVQDFQRPGTLMVTMEPIWPGSADLVPRGARCIANAYTSNHDRIASGEVTGLHALALHAVDAVGLVNAAVLRSQALLMPVRTLVLSGGH
jgi:hypothetical protein